MSGESLRTCLQHEHPPSHLTAGPGVSVCIFAGSQCKQPPTAAAECGTPDRSHNCHSMQAVLAPDSRPLVSASSMPASQCCTISTPRPWGLCLTMAPSPPLASPVACPAAPEAPAAASGGFAAVSPPPPMAAAGIRPAGAFSSLSASMSCRAQREGACFWPQQGGCWVVQALHVGLSGLQQHGPLMTQAFHVLHVAEGWSGGSQQQAGH